jgi:hypothetical protein
MCCFIVTLSTSTGIVFHLDLRKIKFTTTTTTTKTAARTGICDFISGFQIHMLRWGQKYKLYNNEH